MCRGVSASLYETEDVTLLLVRFGDPRERGGSRDRERVTFHLDHRRREGWGSDLLDCRFQDEGGMSRKTNKKAT